MFNLSGETEKSYNRLKDILSELDSVAVSFSGGADSTLLLYVASQIPNLKTAAYTVKNVLIPEKEINTASDTAKWMNIEHHIINLDILSIIEVSANSEDRCYHCKKIILKNIIMSSSSDGFHTVIEGSHTGDDNDYRPGTKAISELKVLSPLKESGFNRIKIKELSYFFGLPTAGKEPLPCLATRIPYGTPLSEDLLKKAEETEKLLSTFGFKLIRARIHGDILRIEISPADIQTAACETVRNRIYESLKNFGYKYITLDLKGYRTGSMNISTEV